MFRRVALSYFWLLAATAGGPLSAVDVIDFGQAPEKWTAAPKSTALGQEALSTLSDSPLPLDQGRIILHTRLRYAHAAQEGLSADHAYTLRTRIGYETPRYYGIYGQAEYENTWAMNLSQYQSVAPQNGRPIINDPRNNQLNQLFLGYEGYNSGFKGGRQTVSIDNQRFVGPSFWRQNDRTLDAVRLTSNVLRDTWLSYAYVWEVNNPSGVYAQPTDLGRYVSRNQLVNVHYDGLPVGQLGAYFYYLDLGDGASGPFASGNSAGLFYQGHWQIDDDWSLPFRAEYAFQTNNNASAPSQGSFWENYWHFILGGRYKDYEIGLGFENIGGNGTRAMQFPLGAKHAYNGWANVFGSIPSNGLRDYYLYYNIGLPYEFKFIGALHYFTAENIDNTYGREVDVGITRKITENLDFLTELAFYDGNGGPSVPLGANVTRFWVQFDFHL